MNPFYPRISPSYNEVEETSSRRPAYQADKVIKAGSDPISFPWQVVSGQLIYLTVRAGETRCPLTQRDLTSCAFDVSETPHVCELVSVT